MSAQDTVLGHFASTASFMSSMASKPAKVKFGFASFSAVIVGSGVQQNRAITTLQYFTFAIYVTHVVHHLANFHAEMPL